MDFGAFGKMMIRMQRRKLSQYDDPTADQDEKRLRES